GKKLGGFYLAFVFKQWIKITIEIKIYKKTRKSLRSTITSDSIQTQHSLKFIALTASAEPFFCNTTGKQRVNTHETEE
ncbi:hypothetical protein, partial [Vibrio vulnificus]|uniref:hypothetical protein n=1 Tax=Vibrio vulnificus TaxID=672 RepID=UPI000580471D